jgi:hypothetical protein
MKTIFIYAMAAWTMWAGYAMIQAGHSFGALLPVAGALMLVSYAMLRKIV